MDPVTAAGGVRGWGGDVLRAVGFGALSLLFGFVQFEVPGVEGALVDLREVGLLIAVFHLRHWALTLIVGAMTSLGTPPEGTLLGTMLFHLIGAPLAWWAHRWLTRALTDPAVIGAVWAAIVVAWYAAIVVPLLAVTSWMFGSLHFSEVGATYLAVMRAVPYEMLSTAAITALYLTNRQELARRRRTEEALRASEQRTTRILAAMPVGVAVVDDGKIAFANDALGELVGVPAHELVGHDLAEQIVHEPGASDLIARLAAGHNGTGASRALRRRDGGTRNVMVHAARLHGAEVDGFAVAFADVTERLRLERQLRQAQKMDALGQLAGGVAHDFNNMLTVISLQESAIRELLDRHAEVGEHLDALREATGHASSVVRQLLSFAREQPASPTRVDLRALLDRVVPMVGSLIDRSIELSLEVAPDLPAVHADATMLEQVVVNLVINARDAVAAREAGPREIRVCATPDAGAVLLSIADTGIGMDEATRARIFEPFFTTKGEGKGTGLGMATVYGAVRQHGATIDVISEVGIGTTMRIAWPLAA